MVSGDAVNYSKEMHLFHHPFSLNSQKVRFALEEKGIDYVSHKVNSLKGRNLDLDFFRMNPTGKIPVFKNGDIIIFDTLTIIEYIDGINEPLGGNDVDHRRMLAWMQKIDEWNPKLFTLSNIPQKYILFFSRFKRQVAIARMAQSPDLADKYHLKLRSAYATEEQLKDQDAVNESTEKLIDVNGSLSKPIILQRSIRQGCPLAPSLFVIAADLLFYLLRDSRLSPPVKGLHLPNNQELLNSQFADVTSIFAQLSQSNFVNLKTKHDLFCNAFGAKISYAKPRLMGWTVDP